MDTVVTTPAAAATINVPSIATLRLDDLLGVLSDSSLSMSIIVTSLFSVVVVVVGLSTTVELVLDAFASAVVVEGCPVVGTVVTVVCASPSLGLSSSPPSRVVGGLLGAVVVVVVGWGLASVVGGEVVVGGGGGGGASVVVVVGGGAVVVVG